MQDLLPYLIREGKSWIASQRERYRQTGVPLEKNELDLLCPYFTSDTLNSVRVCQVTEIENPKFYHDLVTHGQPIPIDFRQMVGITFVETILLASPKVNMVNRISVLFHEFVHVVQYKLLGLDKFVEMYVTGWAKNGFCYDQIPLEKHAYLLQTRFDEKLDSAFRVEEEVTKILADRKDSAI